jgi:hypothetical protein
MGKNSDLSNTINLKVYVSFYMEWLTPFERPVEFC